MYLNSSIKYPSATYKLTFQAKNFYSGHVFFSSSSFFPVCKMERLKYTYGPKTNVSQVTSISQMLWACFEAFFGKNHAPFSDGIFRYQNQHCWIWTGGLDPFAWPWPPFFFFFKPWNLVFSLAKVLQTFLHLLEKNSSKKILYVPENLQV